MKEHPIIFSGESVRAILDGRKTQTRRVVKPQPTEMGYGAPLWSKGDHSIGGKIELAKWCPYGQPGDRLWVRETWTDEYGDLCYRADGEISAGKGDGPGWSAGWKSPFHMRREDSRITLEIVNVRVERLQEISEADTLAEGVYPPDNPKDWKANFGVFWNTINAKRAPWATNPWVWVLEFKRGPF